MAAYGMQIYRDDNSVWWDSRTVMGGIVADVIDIVSGGSLTKSYPAYPGRTCRLVHIVNYASVDSIGITVDTSLGFPRVICAPASSPRNFLVVIF